MSETEAILAWLPADWRTATLAGRIQTAEGPTPVISRAGELHDMAHVAPTMSELLACDAWREGGASLGPLDAFDFKARPLLAPIDLQCVKAAGVTFAVSAVERVIEERARGDADRAQQFRNELSERVGADISSVKPGSEESARLKQALIAGGVWSQYLEVAIGPDAEVFTKAPILSAVGAGALIGVRSDSHWNNPEPEVVIVCDPKGVVIGATLGNDVNLRDFEGRSALLLGKAKDNNASAALGPMIRLFDDGYSCDDVRNAVVSLEVTGKDGFVLEGSSSMRLISRDPLDLARQAMSEHQYPDGFVLYLGTMFAPVKDRDTPGRGFTHKVGDRVRVSSGKLGVLENVVTTSKEAPPWTFGVSALMRNLAQRGLLNS